MIYFFVYNAVESITVITSEKLEPTHKECRVRSSSEFYDSGTFDKLKRFCEYFRKRLM